MLILCYNKFGKFAATIDRKLLNGELSTTEELRERVSAATFIKIVEVVLKHFLRLDP